MEVTDTSGANYPKNYVAINIFVYNSYLTGGQ